MNHPKERILFVDCIAGASGNMWLGALIHAGVPREVMEAPLKKLELGQWSLSLESAAKNGITGIYASVNLEGEDQHPSHHGHPHGADPNHDHGIPYKSIRATVEHAELAEPLNSLVLKVFDTLAQAEGKIHGMSPENVHFHEVGGRDALVDIIGSCAGFLHLHVDRVVVSPIPHGRGLVQCAHGAIPIPAPATQSILKGLQTVGTGLEGEMVTPTGAALLKTFAQESGHMPPMRVDSIGYGLGTRNWPDRPNVLRLVIGETQEKEERLVVMETNIDDMNPEWFEPLAESLREMGVLDVWSTPIQMKKGRLATQLSVLMPQELQQAISTRIFRDSTTLGVRVYPISRETRSRRIITFESSLGACRIKIAESEGAPPLLTPEFDDCLALSKAHHIPIRVVSSTVMEEVKTQHPSFFHGGNS